MTDSEFKKFARLGGQARAAALSPERRREIARKGGLARAKNRRIKKRQPRKE